MKEDRTDFIVLEANPLYWNHKRRPEIKKIVFRNDLTQNQALHYCMDREGEVDIVTEVSPEYALRVQSSKYAKLVFNGGDRIVTGIFNRFQEDVRFSDRRLRLAFNYAINQEEIIREAFHGYAEAVPAFTPPWAVDFPQELKPISYNPSKANQLFNEVKWPDERPLRIVTPEIYQSVATMIAAQLKEAFGVSIKLNILSGRDELRWRRVLAEKKLIPNWDLFIGSPSAFFYEGTPAFFHRECLGADGALRASPVLPEFEKVYQAMARETNQRAFIERAKEVDRFVHNEALALFLCAPYKLYAVNKNVDFRPDRTTFELVDTKVCRGHWSRNV